MYLLFKAYTSQFLTLVMFGLMMSADRLSKVERRKEIIDEMKRLPGVTDLNNFRFQRQFTLIT